MHAFVHVFSLAEGCGESVFKPLLPCDLLFLFFFLSVYAPVFNHCVKNLYCTLFFQSIALNLLKMADCIRDLYWSATGCFKGTAIPWPCSSAYTLQNCTFLSCVLRSFCLGVHACSGVVRFLSSGHMHTFGSCSICKHQVFKDHSELCLHS